MVGEETSGEEREREVERKEGNGREGGTGEEKRGLGEEEEAMTDMGETERRQQELGGDANKREG